MGLSFHPPRTPNFRDFWGFFASTGQEVPGNRATDLAPFPTVYSGARGLEPGKVVKYTMAPRSTRYKKDIITKTEKVSFSKVRQSVLSAGEHFGLWPAPLLCKGCPARERGIIRLPLLPPFRARGATPPTGNRTTDQDSVPGNHALRPPPTPYPGIMGSPGDG